MEKKAFEPWMGHVSRREGGQVIFEKLGRDFKWVDNAGGKKDKDDRVIQVKEELPVVMMTQDEADELNKKTPETGVIYLLPEEKPKEDE